MEIILVMCVGVLVGAFAFPSSLKGVNEKLTLVSTGLLIFSMGAMLGGRDSFLDELASLGLSSLAFAVLPIAFSVAAVYALSRAFMSDITRRHKEDAAHAAARNEVDAAGGEVVMIVMAVGSLVAGVAYGISHVGFGAIDALVAHSDWILTALMFFVGISVGGSKGLVGKVKEYHVRVLIIPAGIIVGSIAGGLVAAFLCGFSLPTGAAIASGLGWYSLSGVTLENLGNATLGSIAFLSNLMRELFSFISIPFVARHFNFYSCIALAGATSEDTTLPMMMKYTNEETVVLSVINGVLCSAVVPVLIPFFMGLGI